MGKVYASSDWHGCADPGLKILDYLQPDDTLYFLGDAIDRGPDGILLLTKLLKDKRVIFVKGNHEQFLEDIAPDLIEGRFYQADLWLANGGRATWNSLKNLPEVSKLWYVHKISKLPITLRYNSPNGHTIILDHAGYSPFDSYSLCCHEPLWDRQHFSTPWYPFSGKITVNTDLDPENTFMVHGHTPVQYLKTSYYYEGNEDWNKLLDSEETDEPKVLRYCDGHKFDIDLGTIISNRIALLDLDTFDTIYFNGGDPDNEISKSNSH